MTIEAALAENTATMRELIDTLKESNAGRAEALAAAKAITEKPAATKAAKDKAKDDKPAETTKPADTGAATGPTWDDVVATVKKYAVDAAAPNAAAEKEARKGKLNELLGKVKCSKLEDLKDKPQFYAGFISKMNDLIAAGNVLSTDDAASDEPEEDPFA